MIFENDRVQPLVRDTLNRLKDDQVKITKYLTEYGIDNVESRINTQLEVMALDLNDAAMLIADIELEPRPPGLLKQSGVLKELTQSLRYNLRILMDAQRML